MKYLILHDGEAFYTDWFSVENNYIPGMVVFDLVADVFTDDGNVWHQIGIDYL